MLDHFGIVKLIGWLIEYILLEKQPKAPGRGTEQVLTSRVPNHLLM